MKLPALGQKELSPETESQPGTTGLPEVPHLEEKPPKKRWKRFVVIPLILLMAFSLVLWVIHRPLLRGIGSLLVYESEIQPSDVIVVLSGGGDVRLEKAIELYQKEYAPRILMTLPKEIPDSIPYHGNLLVEKAINESILAFHHIPKEHVFWSEQPHFSTYSEAVYVNHWLKQHAYKKAIIVSGYFQSNRAKWSFERAMDQEFTCYIVPAASELYAPETWWLHEEGIITVQNEWIKTFYYRLKGLVGEP